MLSLMVTKVLQRRNERTRETQGKRMIMTHRAMDIACCLVVLTTLWSGAPAMAQTPPIAISDHPQLFLDDYLVQSMTHLRRTMEQPAKDPANPVIVQDQPWEARVIEIYGTVLYEPDRNLFRCWYLGSEQKDGIPDNPQHPRTAEYFTCYAESPDGLRWTKPSVGTKPFGTHSQHNIVIEGTHGFCVLPEPADPDPNRRYKGVGGALFGVSPDGVHWETRDWRPAVGKNDTGSCVVRWKDEYLAYVRAQIADPEWPGVMRGVGLSVSRDFDTWTKKETIFATDKEDGYPWVQPYGISVTAYGDVLIGILWLLHLDQTPRNNSLGDQDTQLVVSRDGRTWQRVADRQVFLKATPGAWDGARVFPGTTMFVKDDSVYLYYTGAASRHGEGFGKMAIGLATLPAGRFVALQAEKADIPGILQTLPLTFEGTDLIVNADVADGDLRVELLEANGSVLAGFSREQCRLLPVDPLRYRVVWQTDKTFMSIGDAEKGRPLSLRFILHRGKLFAFQVRSPESSK